MYVIFIPVYKSKREIHICAQINMKHVSYTFKRTVKEMLNMIYFYQYKVFSIK